MLYERRLSGRGPRLSHVIAAGSAALCMLSLSCGAASAAPAPVPGYTLSVISGSGASGTPTPGAASASALEQPQGIAFDAAGNEYVADYYYVEKITPSGELSIIAGNGASGKTVPGPATATPLQDATGVAVDKVGDIYIADYSNHTVDKVTPAGQLSIVAGVSGQDSSGASLTPGQPYPATTTEMSEPSGVAVGPDGSVYVSDEDLNQILKITDGTMAAFAGSGAYGSGVKPTAGPATATALSYPYQMAFDRSGDLYFADSYSNTIDKVTPSGTLSTVAGSGASGSPVAGPATSSPLNYPYGVALDKAGNLYIGDAFNYLIEKVTPSGTLSVIAGDGNDVAPTPGPALESSVGEPYGLAVDATNNIFVADAENYDVYKLAPPAPQPSAPSAPTGLTGSAGNRSARLSFHAPKTSTPPVSGYQYSLDGGAHWLTLKTSTRGAIVNATISGLSNGRHYRIVVRAVNSAGPGTASGPASVTPQGKPKPRPKPWYVDPLTKAQRSKLAPVPAHPNKIHGKARITKAIYRTHNGTLAVPPAQARGHQLARGQAVQLVGLFRFNSAALNKHGRATLTTLARSLKNARAISCEGYADYAGNLRHENSLAAQRAAAVCTAMRHDQKKLQHTRTRSYGPADPIVIGGTAQSRTANRRVDITVTAAVTHTAPKATVPTAPNLRTVTVHGSTATLTFSPPKSNGGAPVTGYDYSTDHGKTWHHVATSSVGSNRTATITGLTPGTNYTFTVRADNRVGDSPASNPRSATAVGVPGAPVITTATAHNPGGFPAPNYDFPFTFTAATSDGGAPVTGYQYSVDGGTWTTFTPSPVNGHSGTFTGDATSDVNVCTNDPSATLTIREVNSAGNGQPSNTYTITLTNEC